MTTFNKHQIADLLVLTVLLALVLGYCWDAYNASSQVINLILVLPLTGLVFILCAIEFINQARGALQNKPQKARRQAQSWRRVRARELADLFSAIGL